jgi:transketolase
VRLGRSKVEDVFDADYKFDINKINVLRKGENVAIFCCGLMVQSSLEAAKLLEAEGVHATVVDVCSLKPADTDGITDILKSHEHIFTVEEHSITGGLGSLICEVASEKCPRIIHRIGMYGFGESGNYKELLKEYKLDGEGVYDQIKGYLGE